MVLPSCGFLNEDPHSGQPADAVITSAAALRLQAVLSLYDLIGSDKDGKGLQGTYRGIYDLQTFASNEAIIPVRGGDWLDGGLWVDLHEHEWAADNECCENAWIYLYGLIGRCNQSLEMIAQYSKLLTDEQRTAYEAEVRAVRAMCYTYLLDLFARVPIVTGTETDMKEIVQSERSEVFAFIWDELQEVLPALPDMRSNTRGEYYGRVTRPVAQFLLMKLALNAEVWTDDNWIDGDRPDGKDIQLSCDGVSFNAWQAVAYYGEAISHSEANYSLCNSVRECFAAYNENAQENIFTIPIDPIVYKNRFKNLFRSLHYQHAAALGLGGENGSCATQETLDVFGYGTDQQDCRFNLFFFSGVVRVNGEPLILSSGDTLIYYPREVEMVLTGSPYVATAGARMRKYEYDPAAIFDGQLQNNDIVLFRLADVYLMIAEAKVRQGLSGQEEFDAVRFREALALGVEMEARVATLENIYYERWIELIWEGWHRQDMIRFDRYITEAANRYQQVFPIPQIAIQTNTRLQQNKGYE